MCNKNNKQGHISIKTNWKTTKGKTRTSLVRGQAIKTIAKRGIIEDKTKAHKIK